MAGGSHPDPVSSGDGIHYIQCCVSPFHLVVLWNIADSFSFLPLSFFTSLFGINAREWSGEATNPTLGQMFEIAGIFPLTHRQHTHH